MELAARYRAAALGGDAMPLATLEDLFLLYCNEGRKDRVVLGLTDTMYKKRLSTAGELNSMAKGGWKNLLRAADAVPAAADVDFIFMEHLGYTDPKKPRFELQFDHFLDACQVVASALYPGEDADGAMRALLVGHFAPLAAATFGPELVESAAAAAGGGSDAGSVLSGRPGGPARVTALVLTPGGTAPASSVGPGTPAVPMLVTTAPHAGPVPGSALPVASPTGPTYKRHPLSLRLTGAGGAGTPDNGSVMSGAAPGSASRYPGSASASWRPRGTPGGLPPASPALMSPAAAPSSASGSAGFAPGSAGGVRMRSPLPAFSLHGSALLASPSRGAAPAAASASSAAGDPAAAAAASSSSSSSSAELAGLRAENAELRGQLTALAAALARLELQQQQQQQQHGGGTGTGSVSSAAAASATAAAAAAAATAPGGGH